ncbi:protein kinase [Oscillochloris trichoides DG-6]|uniref:Protein kinase n=1 Tax=Oscillochloris trichoides DG-6 TaxID=765420 RepID=E1IFT6_9CHLR|nr:serine/threonine-protein kinase [Oscillochloris trichoides]EFO79977.1 protein kinase [Oscillochloris trichoides DG-6]
MKQLAPNDLLQGRYRIQTLIAQGGMGAVYRAVDERLGNTVALKQTLMSDPALRTAFEREARLLANLHHPALPVVSDHFIEGSGQFLVMQYIPGDDLATLLAARSGPFPLAEVTPWADRLLDALDYLHAQTPPIIHRDLKPQNLKLTPRGEIVLLDFGLAKGQIGATQGSAPSLFGYTPQYAPLEQIQGTGTDPRSDLYAFGATCYQLLTGSAPPDALTRAAALVAGNPDPLRPAHLLNPSLPLALSDLLQTCMAQAPTQRPTSAAALRQAWQAATTQATPATPSNLVNRVPSSAGQPTIAMAREDAPPKPNRLAGITLALIGVVAALVMILALSAVVRIFGSTASSQSGGESRPGPTIVLDLAASTATPLPDAGKSRTMPLPTDATAQIESWAVRITGVSRGNDAWDLLYATNSNNDPPPDGQEYVVVHLRAQALQGSEDNPDLYPQLTGDQRVGYLPVAAVTPHQRPDTYAKDAVFDIDIPYLVVQDEGNLILAVDDLGSFNQAPVFVALDAGASVSVDMSLRDVRPTSLGEDPREPAEIGETVITEDFEVTVLEEIRGEAAYQQLLDANQFNDPPKEGYEYLLARVEVRSLSTKDDTVMVSDSDFYTVIGNAEDIEATIQRYPAVVEPEPKLSHYLYPGGKGSGWITVEIPKDTPEVRLVFEPSFASNELNTRYFVVGD